MSDTGDGSDDFDKEAEREKLREKYEQDKQRREVTQHMSDLLLKGATMTNQHCEECGSPVFRHEGEAFCPTCAGTRAVDEGQVADDASEGQPGEDGQPAGAGQGDARRQDAGRDQGAARPQSSAQDANGRAGTDAASGQSAPDPSGDGPSGARGGDRADAGGELGEDDLESMRSRLDERAASRSPNVGGSTDRRRDSPRPPDSPVRSGEVPSMAQSRASLRRAIVSLSEQAAQTDDPGRAHDLLKGAREAAEALAALEGTTGE